MRADGSGAYRGTAIKPLGAKAYGSIGHLPQSRLGPGDHSVHEGQARICLESARDRHDHIVVEEKLDGSCCAVSKVDGKVVALGRAGWPATTSRYQQHHFFSAWVRERYALFAELLDEGERIVGEWLALAHGTLYDTSHPGFRPYIPFDMMRGNQRLTVAERNTRLEGTGLTVPRVVHAGGAISLERIRESLEPSGHGADIVEGVVFRVERRGAVDFLAKWVRPDKVDGCYLPEMSGHEHWHWRPSAREVP